MRASLAALLLYGSVAQAETMLCWTESDTWQRCEGQSVWSRATTGNYGDYTGGQFRAFGTIPATEAVYICEVDRPIGAGEGCPTPGVWTRERFVLKSTLSASVPPAPVPPNVFVRGVELWWTPPTENEDGTPLTNLAGYVVYHGTSSGNWPQSVTINNPGLRAYTWPGLPVGLHFFVVQSRASSGVVSAVSNEARVTIVAPPTACTTPQPPNESRPVGCPPGTTGTWTQTLTYSAAAYPVCWSAGLWLPASPPAGACIAVEVWRVAPTGTTATTRPVHEPVLNLAGTATVRGTVQGRIAVDKPCGAQRFKMGVNSYRDVAESDVVLNSPTYRGREHVTICTQRLP